MKKEELVSISQAKKLKKLGFNEETVYYAVEGLKCKPCKSLPMRWNKLKEYSGIKPKYPYIAIPTITEAVLWIAKKKKYDVHFNYYVHNSDPSDKKEMLIGAFQSGKNIVSRESLSKLLKKWQNL